MAKIRIKLGDDEFEAEGTEESVQAQYSAFLDERKKTTALAPAAAPLAGNGPLKSAPGTFDESLMARIFELRSDDVVALKVLPKGPDKEADALLLLLYGYRRLKNEEHVLATQLLRAATYSGVGVYRPAHALAPYDGYLIRGGQKKGTTYSLNNPGIAKAEEIAAQIFQ